MNTLSRAVTARFFPNSDSYNALRKWWSGLINSERKHELTAAHHLLYLALMGKDWRKAFTPFSNQRKLSNGAFWSWGLFRALLGVHSEFHEQVLLAPFKGLISPEMLSALRSFLPEPRPYHFRPDEFTRDSFPFDAFKQLTPDPAEKANSHE